MPKESKVSIEPKELKEQIVRTPEELHKRLSELEKRHGKMIDIADELRIISMEYADIRSRIEATDILIDHLISQLKSEYRVRKINLVLIVAILVLAALLVAKSMMAGF